MSQPDHVHLEPHSLASIDLLALLAERGITIGEYCSDRFTGGGLDKYALCNWDREGSGKVKPNIDDLTPVTDYDRMERYLTELAMITFEKSRFKAVLNPNSFNPIESGELGDMFDIDWVSTGFNSGFWTMENDFIDPGVIGDWDSRYSDDDEFYETKTVQHSPGEGYYDEPGYYYLETNDGLNHDAVPEFVPDRLLPYDDFDPDNGDRWSLQRIWAVNLLPLAVEHIAGMYMHFFDIVNHPPVLTRVEVQQAGDCRCGSRWDLVDGGDLPSDSTRVAVNTCPSPSRGGWLNDVDGSVSIRLEFGADGLGTAKRMREASVSLQHAGIAIEGTLTADLTAWEGEVTIPSDGSADGIWPLAVSAWDLDPHFEGGENADGIYVARNHRGDELDADPASLALVESEESRNYDWYDYEPGPDTNHALGIDTTGPSITLDSAGVDGLGRTVLVYVVRDATSGVGAVGNAASHNVDVAPESFNPGTDEVKLSITHLDVSHSGSVTLEFDDVAGNADDYSIVIPAIELKNGNGPTPINPGSHGVTPVVIHADRGFDPQTVTLRSWGFGPGNAHPRHAGHLSDRDHDGDLDLMLHFPTAEAGITPGDTSVCLTAETTLGLPAIACQAILAVGGGA
jgi:hypothetical protein